MDWIVYLSTLQGNHDLEEIISHLKNGGVLGPFNLQAPSFLPWTKVFFRGICCAKKAILCFLQRLVHDDWYRALFCPCKDAPPSSRRRRDIQEKHRQINKTAKEEERTTCES